MRSRSRVLRKTQVVPSGHDPSHYVTRRLMAPAHDGEMIPVTLLYRKDAKLDGSEPVWLYGYGSYGISIPAGFNTNILSLVDRGFIYAIALHDLGQPQEAVKQLQALLRQLPRSEDVLLALTNYSAELGQRDQARSYARTLTEIAPGNTAYQQLLQKLK